MKYITIGRQYGSGGRDIGLMLSERLSIPYYDNELIHMASERSGLSKKDIESLDEKGRASLLQSIFANNMPMSMSPLGMEMPYYLNITTSDRIYILQSEIIRELARKESAIFVGRCADYVLKDKKILNVFIHAPIEYRIDKLCDKYKIKRDEAMGRIKKIDKQRTAYYNYFTNKQWSSVESYHMTIDSSRFDHDSVADIVIQAYNKL